MSAWKPRYCHWCGKPIKREGGGKDAKKYCCKPCYFDAVRAGKQQFKGRCHDAWAGMADWFIDVWEPQRPVWMSCVVCGKQMERQGSMHKVCSERCRHRLNNPLHQSCSDCGCPLEASSRAVRRCRRCKKKRQRILRKLLGNYRKRCRHYGVPYDPTIKRTDVFSRDGWRCGLCGKKCLKRFLWVNGRPHPLSPTIDHIVALSLRIKGHTWDNVQCACWQCNVRKSNKRIGQLRLSLA